MMGESHFSTSAVLYGSCKEQDLWDLVRDDNDNFVSPSPQGSSSWKSETC